MLRYARAVQVTPVVGSRPCKHQLAKPVHTLCSTMATATRNDRDAEEDTLEAPTAKPSAAECTSSPTSALVAASCFPCTAHDGLTTSGKELQDGADKLEPASKERSHAGA